MHSLQNHNLDTLYFSLSRLLERTSFYGLRTLIVLYMTGEILKMDRSEALLIYAWVVGAVVLTQIIGALLGDLLIGNRKSIIFGAIAQAIGAFTLCITSTTALYIGLLFVVLGSGLYTPNMISNFGKLHLNKPKLLDSGFTIFYLAVNLGAFLGVLLIGYSGEIYDYYVGFIISGILMILSVVPILISKENKPNKYIKSEFSIEKRIINIFLAFLVVALFWALYEISSIRVFDLQIEFQAISSLDLPKHIWQSINSIFILPVSIIASILWTYLYSNQFVKLLLGFIFGLLAIGMLFLIPETPADEHTMIYLVSLLFLAMSEIHIAPIVYSVLTKYSNPKYLAILISLAFVPTRLCSLIFGLFDERFYDNPNLGLKFSFVCMAVIAIGLFVYVFYNKKLSIKR